MSTLFQASNQWASRPADERFTSLTDLAGHLAHLRQLSHSRVVSSRQLTVAPDPANEARGLKAISPSGHALDVSHWAFGQLAQRAGAPAGYLRSLPAPLAADCVNYGLKVERSVEDLGVLFSAANGAPATLRAVTGPNYGRIWNAEVAQALVDRFGDGISGDFRVPGEFGKAVAVTKDNTTLYASDRDMFVFLADEAHRIEIADRRNGQSGSLARGFFVWNSEVGSSTFGVATFLFDYVCCNRIVWGAKQYKQITIRHTAGAPDRFVEEITPALQAYANSSSTTVVRAIEDARKARLDNVDDFLRSRFTRSQAVAIQSAHLADEGRPIETLWDAATGVTAYARSVPFQDERVALEREGGKLIDLASA